MAYPKALSAASNTRNPLQQKRHLANDFKGLEDAFGRKEA
jgi:hypothetical protein